MPRRSHARIPHPVPQMAQLVRSMLCLLLIAALAGVSRGEPPITALTFSPDGASIIVGSSDGIVVRATEDLSDVELVATSLEQVHDVRFSGDGGFLIAVGGVPAESGAADVYRWPSRELTGHWEAGEDVIYSLDWLAEGDAVVLACFDGATRVISAVSGDVRGQWEGHSRSVTAACVLPVIDEPEAHAFVVTASIDQTLRVVDINSGELVRTLHNHTGPVHALVLRRSEDDAPPMVASISDDRTVRFWQPTVGRMMRFARLESVPLCVAWAPSGDRLVTGCADGSIRIIDPDTAAVVSETPASAERITSLAMHPSRELIAIGTHAGEVKTVSLIADP